MAIPDYCDDRAKKHFTCYFVGSKHGDNGTSRTTSWSSTSGAVPTAIHTVNDRDHYCVYCGNKALPIQANIERHGDYRTTGYCCICKDACDEVEWQEKYAALLEKQEEERELLRNGCPKPSKEVFMKIVKKRTDQLCHDIGRDWFADSALKSLDIIKAHPLDNIKE